MREMPATIVANTIAVATAAATGGQINQGATAAIEYNANSITTRRPPGVETTTLFLSFGVEKIEGKPMSSTIAGTTNQFEYSDAAHGPATHAISSVTKRRLDDRTVSCG